MSRNYRDDIIKASMDYMQAQAGKHKMNIDILISSNVGVAEHPDVMETIEKELEKMAEYHDKYEMLEKYFKQCLTKSYPVCYNTLYFDDKERDERQDYIS